VYSLRETWKFNNEEMKYIMGVQNIDKECSTAALGCDFFFRIQPRAEAVGNKGQGRLCHTFQGEIKKQV